MHLSGFPWYKCNKKLQTLGIVRLQCKKTCWLVNLSSCNESLNLLLLVGLVLLVSVCICSDNDDSFSFATKFYLLFCRSWDDHCCLLHHHLLQTWMFRKSQWYLLYLLCRQPLRSSQHSKHHLCYPRRGQLLDSSRGEWKDGSPSL